MEIGECPDYGLCAAVDVHYLSTGAARAAAVLAADTAFAHVLAERAAAIPRVAPYRPGEFYLRKLPALHAAPERRPDRSHVCGPFGINLYLPNGPWCSVRPTFSRHPTDV